MNNNVFDEKIAEFDAKPKLVKYRAIITAEETYKEENKLKPIYDYFANERPRRVLEVTNIADKYQIAKVRHKRNGQPDEILYHIFVDFKRINVCEYSFDTALIAAICHKYNVEHATMWIERMIGMKYEVEEVEG